MLCSNGVQATSLRKQIKRKGGQAIPPTTYRGGGILAQFLMKELVSMQHGIIYSEEPDVQADVADDLRMLMESMIDEF